MRSCEITDDYTGTTGHRPIIGRYKIVTEGVNKKHKAVNPTVLSDVSGGPEGQGSAYGLISSGPGSGSARHTGCQGEAGALDGRYRALPPASPKEQTAQGQAGRSPAVREINTALNKIELIKQHIFGHEGYSKWTAGTYGKGLREVLRCWTRDLRHLNCSADDVPDLGLPYTLAYGNAG